MKENFITLKNCEVKDIKNVPKLSSEDFKEQIVDLIENGERVVSFFGYPEKENLIDLIIIIANDNQGILKILSTEVKESYKSLTPSLPQVHWFEREIYEQWGIYPERHPSLKPIRFHSRYNSKKEEEILPSVTDFFQIEGEEIHEVAVGPVHAGIIEPGHFRFQCHGEDVFHLEISLGYQHRGIERGLIGGPDKKTIHYIETIAGDTSIGHTLSYCYAIEALSHTKVSVRDEIIRAILLELERLANHTGDLGALANDIGYLPTASYCGRLRGDFLNITSLICGNRFGRNIIRPGGVDFDLNPELIKEIENRVIKAFKDLRSAINLLFNSNLVIERFEGTGSVTKDKAEEIGLVGVAARSCGLQIDNRVNFPCGAYQFTKIPISTYHTGDVFARGYVRWLEIQESVKFILDSLKKLINDNREIKDKNKNFELEKDKIVVSLVEGWRGEICHTIITDKKGKFKHYKIVDPSFHNWFGLALALRGEEISNFPLCNKSFNLSYCGHDL